MKIVRNLLLLALAACPGAASAANEADLVTSLPGLATPPSFKQYTGHLQVQTQEKLFYWYTESQENPATDPIVLWLNGGPGCSSLGGFFTENGPFVVAQDLSVEVNPYSWNRKVNLVWLESPAGVGFSGPVQDPSYYNDDTVAARAYEFIDLFFAKFPELQGREFYITGESYAGIYIPYLVNLLVNKPIEGVSLKGFAIGNPYTDAEIDGNAYIDYYYTHGMISLENYRALNKACANELASCINDGTSCSDTCQAVLDVGLLSINEDALDPYFIYGDKCLLATNQGDRLRNATKPKSVTHKGVIGPCSEALTQSYLNLPDVQAAIHVPETVSWTDCNDAVSDIYTRSDSSLPKYANILGRDLNALIYSGDADSVVNFIGTERWIGEDALKLNVTKAWAPWFGADQQLAGYVQEYQGLTFKTVKGAGHMVPAVRPLHGLQLFETFVFGEEKASTFEYPKNDDELETGAYSSLSASVIETAAVWAPVAAVASAVVVLAAVGARNSKKRGQYQSINSSV